MFQKRRVGPVFAFLLALLIVPLKAAGSLTRSGPTADSDNSEMTVYQTRTLPATELTSSDLKSLFTFELSHRDRQDFYLHDSQTRGAGVSLPSAPKFLSVVRLKRDLPGKSYYSAKTREATTSRKPVGAALQADPPKRRSRVSRITSSVQGPAMVMAGLLLAFLGGAIVLAALVVTVSFLSRASNPFDGVREESAFAGNYPTGSGTLSSGRSETLMEENWQRVIANHHSGSQTPEY